MGLNGSTGANARSINVIFEAFDTDDDVTPEVSDAVDIRGVRSLIASTTLDTGTVTTCVVDLQGSMTPSGPWVQLAQLTGVQVTAEVFTPYPFVRFENTTAQGVLSTVDIRLNGKLG